MAELNYRVIANYDWRIQAGQDTKAVIAGKAIIAGIPATVEKENSDPVDGTLLQTHFLTTKDQADALRDIVRATYGIYGAKADIISIPLEYTMQSGIANAAGSGLPAYHLPDACGVNLELFSQNYQGVQAWPLLVANASAYGQDAAGNYYGFSGSMVNPAPGTCPYTGIFLNTQNFSATCTLPPAAGLKVYMNGALRTIVNVGALTVPAGGVFQTYMDHEFKLYPKRLVDPANGGVQYDLTYTQAIQVGQL